MTWTYSGNPASSSKDAVRWYAGDTNSKRKLVTDEEIAFALVEESNARRAAIHVLEAVLARFSHHGSVEIGGYKLDAREIGVSVQAALAVLRAQATTGKSFFAGGVDRDEMQTQRDDSDNVRPGFQRGMHSALDITRHNTTDLSKEEE